MAGMNIKATASANILKVSGLPSFLPRNKVKLWLSDIASEVESRIAEDFDNERGAGLKLIPNSQEYDDWKAANGFDSRRGHKEGILQEELDAGGFASVSVMGATGKIVFSEQLLFDRVGYAEYYVANKVKGGKLLVFLKKDAAFAAEYLNDRAAEIEANLALKKARRDTRALESGLSVERLRERGARGVRVRVA